ncbi:MAG: RNA polymerase sigma factor [Acidimicrobiia bacterium]
MELVRSWEGDGVAEIYERCAPVLVRVAFLLTGSRADAEDAVQDVFARCAVRLHSVDHPESYLRTVLVNECRTRHRRARRDGGAGVERAVSMPEHLVELRDALAGLGERRRAAVVLRYFCDLDYSEIAVLLRCRETTARSLVHRAVRDLRGALQ